jgi:hypothetical protein
MRRPWLLPALSGALIVLVLAAWGIPWLTRDRNAYTSTPTPPPFSTIAPIELRPGSQVCETLVALEPATRGAAILTAKPTVDGPPLRVTARAPAYSSSATIPGGYGALERIEAPLDAPPRSAIGRVCVENMGRRRVTLQGTTEGRVQTRSATLVDGVQRDERMPLLLTEGRPRSVADRPGEIADHIAAFKPPLVGRVSLALVALLILAGVPAAVVYAVARGIAEDEPGRD